MNAAARLIHQSVISRQGILSRHSLFSFSFVRKQMCLLILIFTMILSALSVVYMSYHTRILHAQLQKSIKFQNHLQIQQGQLLLEKSTWTMESRIQQIAEQKLSMTFPNHKSVVIIHE